MAGRVGYSQTMRGHWLRRIRCFVRRRHDWYVVDALMNIRRSYDPKWRAWKQENAGRRCEDCGRAEVAFQVSVGTGSTKIDAVRLVRHG